MWFIKLFNTSLLFGLPLKHGPGLKQNFNPDPDSVLGPNFFQFASETSFLYYYKISDNIPEIWNFFSLEKI